MGEFYNMFFDRDIRNNKNKRILRIDEETRKEYLEKNKLNKFYMDIINLQKRVDTLKLKVEYKKSIQDRMAVLKELINKSLDINNKKDFEKYSKEYKELINNI